VDVTEELGRAVDRMSDEPLPATWRSETALADMPSFGALVARIRRLDSGSDEVLRALARLAVAGEREACLVVTAALLPLLIVRCDRRPALIAEAVNELAARVGEPADESAAGGVANRLLRRVVWRVRHERGVGAGWQRLVPDLDVAALGRAPVAECFEARTVDRLALEAFRRRLARRPAGHEAWAVLVESVMVDLSLRAQLSSTERSRLAKHRRSVRRLADRSLVA
jgi:hypothetical protein